MGQELTNKIIALAYENTGVELSSDENLKASGLDSLSLVVLIAAIEDEFGFQFNDDDLQPDNLNTLSDIKQLVEKYI